MRRKVRHTFHISRRLYRILLDVERAFYDHDLELPQWGAANRAIEHILQYYAESEDYQRKLRMHEDRAKKVLKYLIQHDKDLIQKMIKDIKS